VAAYYLVTIHFLYCVIITCITNCVSVCKLYNYIVLCEIYCVLCCQNLLNCLYL